MPFNGGGGGALPPHKHTNIANDGSPLDFGNVTVGSMNAGDITFSDGAALQTLAYPGVPAGETLTAAALSTAPSWAAAAPAATVWTELADVTLGAAGQLSSGTFAAHDLLDIWILGANTVSQNTAVTFNNDGTANYKYNWTIDGAYAAIADDTELGINGGNSDHVSFIHLKTFYDTTTTDTGITWQGMNFVSGGGNTPISLSGWGYYSGSQITQVDKSQFGAIAIDQKIGARIIVLGAI